MAMALPDIVIIPMRAVFAVLEAILPLVTILGKFLRHLPRLTLIILPVIMNIVIILIPMLEVSAVVEATLPIVTTRAIFQPPIQIHLYITLTPPLEVFVVYGMIPSQNAITPVIYHPSTLVLLIILR